MRIVYVNGARSDLSWHEMRRLFWHPYFVGLVLLVSAFVIALRPYDDMVDLNVVRLTIFYANSVGFFVLLLVGSVYVAQRMGRTIYASVVVALSIILATVYGVVSATLLGATIPPAIDIVMVTIFNLVFGVVGEVIFVSFLVPRILKDLSSRPLDQPEVASQNETIQSFLFGEAGSFVVDHSTPMSKQNISVRDPTISILGVEFRSEDVSMLSAEAHYVSVVQRNGRTKMLRGRISDAADAMPPELGRMVHRSHWVAAHAVDKLVQDGRNYVLLLKDGRRLPVARNRQQDIRNWVDQLS